MPWNSKLVLAISLTGLMTAQAAEKKQWAPAPAALGADALPVGSILTLRKALKVKGATQATRVGIVSGDRSATGCAFKHPERLYEEEIPKHAEFQILKAEKEVRGSASAKEVGVTYTLMSKQAPDVDKLFCTTVGTIEQLYTQNKFTAPPKMEELSCFFAPWILVPEGKKNPELKCRVRGAPELRMAGDAEEVDLGEDQKLPPKYWGCSYDCHCTINDPSLPSTNGGHYIAQSVAAYTYSDAKAQCESQAARECVCGVPYCVSCHVTGTSVSGGRRY